MNTKILKGGGICVFIRAYNDLDHITPVIYKLNEKYSDIPIDIILIEFSTNFENDYRIKFLRQLGIKVSRLSDFGLISASGQRVYFQIKKLIKNKSKYNPMRVFLQRLVNLYERKNVRLIDNIKADQFIDQNFEVYPKLFLFDQSRIPFYSNLCAFAKFNNITTIAVPHGHTILSNELHYDTFLQINPGEPPHKEKLVPSKFDFIVYENDVIANRYIQYGNVKKEQSVIIGSARFTDEWIKKMEDIIDKQDIQFGKNKKLKIGLMLSKITYNGFQAEIDRTIEFITWFNDVFLIVKPHTRYKRIVHEQKDNLFIDNNHEYHSPNLIKWADLIIFEHSCICFHALKLDKPVIYLSSTHANRLMSEPYFTSWEAKCRDDIRKTIWCMLYDKNYRTYEKEDAQKFMNDIIQPVGPDVLAQYAAFIYSIIN